MHQHLVQVLQLLVPLLIFFVAFSALPRERELGTLPLLLTQGVRFDDIVLGKALGIFAVVVLWTAPALAATLLALSVSASWTWDADLLSRVVLLSLGYGAYLWICTLGAVIVSALHWSSRSSLATLITIGSLFGSSCRARSRTSEKRSILRRRRRRSTRPSKRIYASSATVTTRTTRTSGR